MLLKPAKVPIFRKVFKKGHVYTCGICRSDYPTRAEANTCLNYCWYSLKEQYPLVIKSDIFQSKKYRCQLCFREYKTEDAGLECAAICMDLREKVHVQEQLSNDLEITTKPRRRFKLVRVVPQEVQKSPAKDNPTLDEEMDQTEEALPDSIAPEQEPNVEPEAAPPPEEPTIIKRHKSEFDGAWVREGAKYKCRYCSELYYTKMEAEECFNGHFDEEGLEKFE